MSAPDPANIPTYAIIGIVILGIVTILPLGAAVLFVGSWVGRVDTKATNAEKQAELARERAHDLANQLANYQADAARQFVSHDAVNKLESRIMEAIGSLGNRIDRFFSPKGPIS